MRLGSKVAIACENQAGKGFLRLSDFSKELPIEFKGVSSSINALAFNGSTLYGSHQVTGATTELITINTTTAAITVVGPTVDRLDAIVFE